MPSIYLFLLSLLGRFSKRRTLPEHTKWARCKLVDVKTFPHAFPLLLRTVMNNLNYLL